MRFRTDDFRILHFNVFFVVMGCLMMFYKGGVAKNAVLFVPIFTYFGYMYLKQILIDIRMFNIVFIFLYIYFYIIYFSKLPNLFYRPGFDEDAIVFERASSNGIAVALNITLYAYVILNYLFKQKQERSILIISIINLILIIIQQSRSGIICAGTILLIVVFVYYKKYFFRLLMLFLFFIVFSSSSISRFVGVLEEIGISSKSYSEDSRSAAVFQFFNNISKKDFFWGTPLNTEYEVGSYTFNVFLEIWNNYTFLAFLFMVMIFLFRFILRKYFYFPVYFFIPFFIYAFSEAFFFPEYWDVIILIMLFHRKKDIIFTNRNIAIKKYV